MTEAKALILNLTAGVVVLIGAFFALRSMGASTEALVLVYIAVLGATSYAASSIVMHYGAKRRRR
jgi:hypothetical protein